MMDLPAPSARDRLGRLLGGKYRLESVLGSGGTAVVYRASDSDGEPVAVKVLHEHLTSSPEIRARFMREVYVANLVAHPGTVRVLDDGVTEDGILFFVLELLEGATVEEIRDRSGGCMPLPQVLSIADDLLTVLELAHARGVVHRDVKPSNLFVTREGILKVLDFGIARIVDAAGSATVTRTGQTMGTPAFMPPEQALSKPREIDAQSDLWAVGATMFTLLSGEHVHAAESASEHLVKAATAEARSIAKVLRGVPANVERFLAKALSFNKRDRFHTAREMREALAAVRRDPGVPLGTSTAPPPRSSASNAPTVVSRPSGSPGTPMALATPVGVPARGPRSLWVALAVVSTVALVLGARAVHVATEPAAAAALHTVSPAHAVEAPPPASTLLDGVREGAGPVLPKAPPAAPPETATPAPPTAGRPAPAAPTSSGAVRSTPRGTAAPPRTAPARPKTTSTPDLYRPF